MLALVLLSWCWSCMLTLGQRLDHDSWTGQEALYGGLCRYGNSVECCWGWRQMDWGSCQPHCQHGCKHGECVAPDTCMCHPGYTGKACNQDLNECGLKPRPCKHRCMNTLGSYKCYCLDGYVLQPDGSCRNARTCYHANCQYGCEVVKGEVRCTCPSPGLRLGPDRRTCVDVDECVSGGGVCPRRRKCVNTFGSFFCNCHLGFRLVYIDGRYTCIDNDPRPFCSLNPSSPKCRCRDGSCHVIPRVTIEPQRPRTTAPITITATTAASTTTSPTTPAITAGNTPATSATTALPTTTFTTVTTAMATPAPPFSTSTTTKTSPEPTTTTINTAVPTTTTVTTNVMNTTTAATTTETVETTAPPTPPPPTTTTAATTTETVQTTAPPTPPPPTTTTAATTTETVETTAPPTPPPPTTTTAATTTETVQTTAPPTPPPPTTTTAATTTETVQTTAPPTPPPPTTTTAATTTETVQTTAPPTPPPPTTTTAATTTETVETTAPPTPPPPTTTTAATTTETVETTAPPTPPLPTTTTAATTTETVETTAPPTLPPPPAATTTETVETTAPPTPPPQTTTTTATTVPTIAMTTRTLVTTTLNNKINKDVTPKQRGDVHIPRQHGHNQVWEFDIELGNTAEDARDDPEAGVLHCSFDHGVCDWMSDREGDLHWEVQRSPAGGAYLSVPELKEGQRSIRGARLAVQIDSHWSPGDLCFSFSYWLSGHHVGVLQLFLRGKGRGQRYGTAMWTRTSGHGWRQMQFTMTADSVDGVLLKAERRNGRRGQIAVDDVILRQGACR